MVRKEGVEPSLREPQSLVLPLHYIGDMERPVGFEPTMQELQSCALPDLAMDAYGAAGRD